MALFSTRLVFQETKSTTNTPSFPYAAPRWETSAALQSHLSVQLSPLHHSQQILVTLAPRNSQLCVLHSDCPLGSVCVQSPCAAACKLYPGKKLGKLGYLRAHLVSFPSLGNHCPVWPEMPWHKALWFFVVVVVYSGGRANWLLGNSSCRCVHPGFNCFHWFFCFLDVIKLLHTAKSQCAYRTVFYFAPPTIYSIFEAVNQKKI